MKFGYVDLIIPVSVAAVTGLTCRGTVRGGMVRYYPFFLLSWIERLGHLDFRKAVEAMGQRQVVSVSIVANLSAVPIIKRAHAHLHFQVCEIFISLSKQQEDTKTADDVSSHSAFGLPESTLSLRCPRAHMRLRLYPCLS